MKKNFTIVLFKNRKKKKTINHFKNLNMATRFFERLIQKSNSVIFPKEYENGFKITYEIAFIEKKTSKMMPIYIKDEFGRQLKIKLDDDKLFITRISPYKEEELILDHFQNKKIPINELINLYLKPDGIKLVSKIHNKIIIQHDDDFKLFTLKNEEDGSRLIDTLSEIFLESNRVDTMFIKDYSIRQRKYLYDILVEKGFDKKYLFRKSTTHPVKT